MLLSSRTPLRVSFFGGGSDYPEYFEHRPGAVVGMAIDRYVYVSALRLSDIIDYKYRLSYSRLERVAKAADLEHPVVRAVLEHFSIEDALDVSIQSHLPASSGLGSSSAFTVGLVNLVAALEGSPMTRLELARTAIHVERELLQENVGIQDQLHSAFGGINRFDFSGKRIRITPIQMTAECQAMLTESLVLVYTGRTRFASQVATEQVKATRERRLDEKILHLVQLTTDAVEVLEGDDPDALVRDLGAMLSEAWKVKRALSSGVTSPEIDELCEAGIAAGAVGTKLCGAGGGGFLLMLVPQGNRARFDERMRDAHVIPVGLDREGSVILRG